LIAQWAEIREYLESWFEPQRDMDRKVEICGSALFHALFRDHYPETGLRELIRYWVGLRNWAETAQLAFTGYVVRRPKVFLDVAEEFWSSGADSGAAQEFFRASFIANRDNTAIRPLLERSIRRWMGFVHPSGRRPADQDVEKDRIVRREIEARAGCPVLPGEMEVAGTQLIVVSDLPLLRLGRFALLIMSAGDALPFIGALANWAVASAAMDDGDFNDLVSWVVRLSDTDVDSILVAEARRLVAYASPVAREAARLLLWAIGSKRSRSLIDEYDLTPEWYKERLAEHGSDPCKSFYAWNEEEVASCLRREDVDLYTILERAKCVPIDPSAVLPPSLIKRAQDALTPINPNAIRASTSHTLESHALETLTPILCAHRPHELADFMRSVVRTMPAREMNGQYFLAMMLPEISLLLTGSEIAAVSESIDSISVNASEWSEREISGPRHMAKHAEARALP